VVGLVDEVVGIDARVEVREKVREVVELVRRGAVVVVCEVVVVACAGGAACVAAAVT
jgi:hypothetical protein